MFRKGILALFVLMLVSMGVSAKTVDVTDANAYDDTGVTLTYTVVQENNQTIKNCTLYANVNGSWGVEPTNSLDSTITNGSNTFTIAASSFASYARGDTALWNVLCYDNASKNEKDATNGTLTFYVYTSVYSTTDLNEQVVDILGTGINATISWVDLLVLLAIVGVSLSMVMGALYKGGKIFGLG